MGLLSWDVGAAGVSWGLGCDWVGSEVGAWRWGWTERMMGRGCCGGCLGGTVVVGWSPAGCAGGWC